MLATLLPWSFRLRRFLSPTCRIPLTAQAYICVFSVSCVILYYRLLRVVQSFIRGEPKDSENHKGGHSQLRAL